MKYSLIIVACTLMFACSDKKENKTTENNNVDVPVVDESIVQLSDAQFKNANITTTTLSSKNISSVIKVNGKIDVPPQNLVSVSVPLGGYIKSTKLLPGMHIRQGEVIAIIEDQQYIQIQQDYLMAKSKLHFAELEYKRQRTLNESKASSDKMMQLSESEYRSSQILLNSYAEKLKLINIQPNSLSNKSISKSVPIYSPINGFVSKVNVNIGKYVNPSEILFELVNPSDIHLNLKVFERDLSKLEMGMKVKAFTNASPERIYNCEIILISKDIAQDGTCEVHCHFESYDKLLVPGMYMNAEIELMSSMGNALPDEAIVDFEGKQFIFIDNGKHQYQLQEVNVIQHENGFTTISNIPNTMLNKSIVQHGAYALLMKMKNTEE